MQPIRLSPTGEPDAPALTRDQRLELAPAGRTKVLLQSHAIEIAVAHSSCLRNLVPERQFSEATHQLLIRAGNIRKRIGGVECLRKSGCWKHMMCS